jgi:GNAT superfamily N-acetyltransferase
VIRGARPEDVEALADLQIRAHREAYAGYVDVGALESIADPVERAATWRERLAQDDPITLVVDDLSGYVTVGATRDADTGGDGELYSMYVEPGLIGTGRGAELLRAAEELLRERFACATLWVFAANARARGFYERHGWSVDERPFDPDRWQWAPSVRYRKCW